MFERHEAGEDGPLVRIDATVFEALSLTPLAPTPRIERWLATWAGRDR